MKRRTYIKSLMMGCLASTGLTSWAERALFDIEPGDRKNVNFQSDWHLWPNMKWAGPAFWGNRLQDWEIQDGKVVCVIRGKNRTLQLLTLQCPHANVSYQTEVTISPLLRDFSKDACFGLLLGAKGPIDDYRSAAVFGKGLIVGLNTQGVLIVGNRQIQTDLNEIPEKFVVNIQANSQEDISITIKDKNEKLIVHKNVKLGPEENLIGNFALYANVENEEQHLEEIPSCAFSDWTISSKDLEILEDQAFGPVCFAQYTVNKGLLKLLVQCCPFEKLNKQELALEIFLHGRWKLLQKAALSHDGRVVLFRIENWHHDMDIPYRIRTTLGRNDTGFEFDYLGTIACEPKASENLTAVVFNCNAHYGFPDGDIFQHAGKLPYDLCLFLGDQFYESTGGYGVQYAGDFDKRCLDFLRKWYMFGWSYRELFRHRPCAIITDDHDVYHGNLWGCGGEHADTSQGFGYSSQDSGGYKMDAQWVNTLQFTQTGHLPDPVDPTVVKQGINVYYTEWQYAGISFAIIEDRKFKSAPQKVLPVEANVRNGFILNKNFDITQHRDVQAELLGARQEKFLKEWVEDWGRNIQMKVLVSQTNFATIATLPADAQDDSVVPKLKIPEPGEYIVGDVPTVDMDSNGWPQNKRDEALKIIRKGMVFHIAGDQHLGTFVQYGVHEHGDCGYAFTGPALNNLWPRRFWPASGAENHKKSSPGYCGNHIDGFGNKFTVYAVANPSNAHKKPVVLHNRANGYGLVTFDKIKRTIQVACFKRFYDPGDEDAQYPGWPITIKQEDNLLSNAKYVLPKLRYDKDIQPVLRVLDAKKQLVYTLRMPQDEFQPRVFTAGKYYLIVEDPAVSWQEMELMASDINSTVINISRKL